MEAEIPIPEGDGKIPDFSPVINQEEEAPEIYPYKISFNDKYYKDSECEVRGMSKPNAACALKILRDVGVHFVDQNNFLKETLSYTEIKHVANDNRYRLLYKNLGLDEAIYEIKCVHHTKEIDFRLFYTLNETERVFQVVAIRQTHY